MKKAVVKIVNQSGLHARPASMFVKVASQFKSEVEIECEGRKGNGKSIIGVMSLGIGANQEFTIITDGEDEETALKALVDLVQNDFE